MKIIVLDGVTLNPGDLSWDDFKKLGDLTVYDRTSKDKIIERIGDAEIVITNKTVLYKEILDQLPNIKYIGLLSTGKNAVDLENAIKLGITVTYVPSYSTPSVAQMTFSLILELCNNVGLHNKIVHEGKWAQSKDFCFWNGSLIELSGKTVGIIGLGDIGKGVAKIARSFDMRVLACSLNNRILNKKICEQVTLNELLENSDIVSIHCPYTPETLNLINKDKLSLMKKSSFLINTARGPIINEKDLAEALNNDIIAGAGVDVLSIEPPSKENPLLTAKNCIITPHISWATKEARERLMKTAYNNLLAFETGNPINTVSHI